METRMIFDSIQKQIKIGDSIPKPDTKKTKVIEIKPNRNGELSLYYSIGKQGNSKFVTKSDFENAFDVLNTKHEFTRKWFNEHLDKKKSKPCNFTTIGGVFELLGKAKFIGNGIYKKSN